MSCPETNPCDPCQETNGCYDNCGCINPTTWECVSTPGDLPAIGVTNDMTGKEVLQAINDTIEELVIEPPIPGSDIYVKCSVTDTTAGYLNTKIFTNNTIDQSVINSGANEKVRLAVNIANLISGNTGNLLTLGTDGKLRVTDTSVPDVTYIEAGSGVTLTGAGLVSNPYVISINPSITAARSCFDGVWRNVTLAATGNPDVVYVSGTPQYRVRFDGSIELKGSAQYTVNFGTYASTNRKRTVTIGNINDVSNLTGSCGVTSGEMAGTSDLKSMVYIDQPGLGDQITQSFGYIIRKTNKNILIEFQSYYVS